MATTHGQDVDISVLPLNENYEKRRDNGLCLHCGEQAAKTRGLCKTCYATMSQRIARKIFTREEAIAKKWLLPEKAKSGRKSKRPDPLGSYIAQKKSESSAPLIPPKIQDYTLAETPIPAPPLPELKKKRGKK